MCETDEKSYSASNECHHATMTTVQDRGSRMLYVFFYQAQCSAELWQPKTPKGLITFFPKQCGHTMGSYGNGKASGVDRWCALTRSAFLATLSLKSSLEIENLHFACTKRGRDEVHFGGAFSPARRVDFPKSGNVQNVRVLRGVRNRRKGCSKLEVVKNRFFRGRRSIWCS